MAFLCLASLASHSDTPLSRAACRRALVQIADLKSSPLTLHTELFRTTQSIDYSIRPEKINNPADSGSGSMNGGVFLITNSEGQKEVVKFVDVDSFSDDRPFTGKKWNHPSFNEYHVIHRVLGELGMAPKLIGVLMKDEANKYAKEMKRQGYTIETKRKAYEGKKENFVGLIMEPQGEVWNVPKSSTSPKYVSRWAPLQLAKVLKTMKQMAMGNGDRKEILIYAVQKYNRQSPSVAGDASCKFQGKGNHALAFDNAKPRPFSLSQRFPLKLYEMGAP